MKVLGSLALIITFFICSCEKEEQGNSNLLGKWKLVQTYMSIGGPLIYTDAPTENPTYLELKKNGGLVYSNTDYIGYSVKDSVTVSFIKKDKTSQNFHFRIDNGILDLSPAGPIFCIEGCGSRFKKLD